MAMSFSLTSVARKPRMLVERPQEFPFTLLSDVEANDPAEFSTDPGVMGEVEMVRERYSDGAIHIERQITLDRDGNYVNHGGWKMFAQSGDVLAEGQYHFGKRVGMWTRWHAKNDSAMFSETAVQAVQGPLHVASEFHRRQDGRRMDHRRRQRSQGQPDLAEERSAARPGHHVAAERHDFPPGDV